MGKVLRLDGVDRYYGWLEKSVTFDASNTTESETLWTLTGAVIVHRLYYVVTTVIGVNHTAAYFRLNDGTNTPAITASGGTTISAATVGSIVMANRLAATAVTLANGSEARVNRANGANDLNFQDMVLTAKNGATTTLEYRYSTTDTPTTGAVTFFCVWSPLSSDGNLV